jgi:autotransporter-associated beta strand protein
MNKFTIRRGVRSFCTAIGFGLIRWPRAASGLVATILLVVGVGHADPILVVERVGDGSSHLTNNATPVFLQMFHTDATDLGAISLPLGPQRPVSPPFHLMDSGSSGSDGQLTRSVSGMMIQVPGYNATNGELNITASPTNPVLRTIGLMTTDGVVDTSRAVPIMNSNNFRSVVSVDGTAFWAAGQSGLAYVNGSQVTQMSDLNYRAVNIFNGQLYCSTASGTPGIYTVGSGLPTTAPAPPYIFLAMPGASASPYAFQMNTTMSTCYIADDGTNAGVVKFSYSGGVWVSNYTLNVGGGVGARGLTVDWAQPSAPVVYATTAESASNRLIKIVDTGPASAVSLISAAPKKTAYRGVDFLGLPSVWRVNWGGNWSTGGTTPWYNWSTCPVNDVGLQFPNVNSGAVALSLATTNNTSLTWLSSISFAAAGYGGGAGTSYTLRGNAIQLSRGISSDSPLTQTIKLPISLIAPQTLQTGPGNLVLDGALSGGFALNKTGAGTLILNATNSLTGSMAVYGGPLEVNGVLTNSSLNLVSATLGGTGTISGTVAIQSGGTLAPAGTNAIGTLTIRGALNLLGTTVMEVKKTGTVRSSDCVAGISTLTNGGTLSVRLLGGTLAAGDSFTLFRSTRYVGTFANVNLPALGAGFYWDTTLLASAGTIKVGAITPARLGRLTRASDGTVTINFSGSPGLTYQVWASSDPTLFPIATTWAWLGSGTFGADGLADFFDWSAWQYGQRFYVISVP